MEIESTFDKEMFSIVLSEIYNQYPNQRQFAKRANINRTYISKYINKKLEFPPSAKILRRLANVSKGITTYQELMQICGYLDENEIIISNLKTNIKDECKNILEVKLDGDTTKLILNGIQLKKVSSCLLGHNQEGKNLTITIDIDEMYSI